MNPYLLIKLELLGSLLELELSDSDSERVILNKVEEIMAKLPYKIQFICVLIAINMSTKIWDDWRNNIPPNFEDFESVPEKQINVIEEWLKVTSITCPVDVLAHTNISTIFRELSDILRSFDLFNVGKETYFLKALDSVLAGIMDIEYKVLHTNKSYVYRGVHNASTFYLNGAVQNLYYANGGSVQFLQDWLRNCQIAMSDLFS